MTTLALTELLGATVYDPSGAPSGRVREVTLTPQEDRSRISSLIVKTKSGNRVLPFSAVSAINGGVRATTAAGEWLAANGTEGLFLLERDLLDQQVIDVNGRKVVRVNDVDLQVDAPKDKDKDADRTHPVLRVLSVDVGARGAVRPPSSPPARNAPPPAAPSWKTPSMISSSPPWWSAPANSRSATVCRRAAISAPAWISRRWRRSCAISGSAARNAESPPAEAAVSPKARWPTVTSSSPPSSPA